MQAGESPQFTESASSLSMSPSSMRISRSMKYGFPAKAEKLWYGLSPYPVGPTGSTCQYFCFESLRKSTKSNAAFPNVPMPYFEGRLATGRSVPAPRFNGCCFLSIVPVSVLSIIIIPPCLRVLRSLLLPAHMKEPCEAGLRFFLSV